MSMMGPTLSSRCMVHLASEACSSGVQVLKMSMKRVCHVSERWLSAEG